MLFKISVVSHILLIALVSGDDPGKKPTILTNVDEIRKFLASSKPWTDSEINGQRQGRALFQVGPAGPLLRMPTTNTTSITMLQPELATRSCPLTSVCAPAGQCLLAGGVSVGNCAMGFLRCCARREEIPTACSASNKLVAIKDRAATLASTSEAKSCRYEIYKAADNICSLQVDLDAFEMEPPIWGEDCSPESMMTISESVTVRNGFPLCGIHNGTTLHLGYGRSNRISLSFSTTFQSSYFVRVKQIECNAPERVPDQCLQNYESSTGIVKSFGFPQYMINNQKYTVCIQSKAVSDIGQITWKECTMEQAQSDSKQNFILSEYFIDLPQLVPTLETENYKYKEFYFQNYTRSQIFLPAEGLSCKKTSHVEFYGEEKHCGARFLSSAKKLIRSEARPYMMSVNFVQDSSKNLPDFIYYYIKGIERNGSEALGTKDPLPQNDCELFSDPESISSSSRPNSGGGKGKDKDKDKDQNKPDYSTQGFESCQIVSKSITGIGKLDYDFCVCGKKSSILLPEVPEPRPDLIERKGFCLYYNVS